MTFGAPMVLHSMNAAEMYTALQQHMARHSPLGQQLHIHSFVNNADVVPRVLGPQLDGMYQAVHALVPSIQVQTPVSICTRQHMVVQLAWEPMEFCTRHSA